MIHNSIPDQASYEFPSSPSQYLSDSVSHPDSLASPQYNRIIYCTSLASPRIEEDESTKTAKFADAAGSKTTPHSLRSDTKHRESPQEISPLHNRSLDDKTEEEESGCACF
ncbi:unnamed protein product [Microthlaspi erraticum]|uniref:Uncharacterized protein n=1 Tax=Microthlaspi erraticum TaxID=1685480 RepID=A0A6D2IQB1_9BRAS|nr:unnamed protein product [Microthlaspi erraticum]